MEVEFEETQKFTQWWLWPILIIARLLPFAFIDWEQLLKNPTNYTGLFIGGFISLGVIAFFRYVELKTKINRDRIIINFSILGNRKIEWSQVKNIKLIEYGFVGYGLRFSPKYGTVYNVKGNQGLAIDLKGGDKILIGTKRPPEIEKLIEKMPAGNIP
ncbi:MAG: hypothetical protein AAF632_08360 [Bacteroidota bacterium]